MEFAHSARKITFLMETVKKETRKLIFWNLEFNFSECKRCPVDTVPNYGFQYSQWETLPPNLSTKCEYMSDGMTIGTKSIK